MLRSSRWGSSDPAAEGARDLAAHAGRAGLGAETGHHGAEQHRGRGIALDAQRAGELHGAEVGAPADHVEQRARRQRDHRLRRARDGALDREATALQAQGAIAPAGAGHLEVHQQAHVARLRGRRQVACGQSDRGEERRQAAILAPRHLGEVALHDVDRGLAARFPAHLGARLVARHDQTRTGLLQPRGIGAAGEAEAHQQRQQARGGAAQRGRHAEQAQTGGARQLARGRRAAGIAGGQVERAAHGAGRAQREVDGVGHVLVPHQRHRRGAAVGEQAPAQEIAKRVLHARAHQDGGAEAGDRDVGVRGLEGVEVLLDGELAGGVGEVGLVDALRGLQDGLGVAGQHAVGGHRRAVQEARDVVLPGRGQHVVGAADVDGVELRARQVRGHHEGQVDDRVGAGEVRGDGGIADVGAPRGELAAGHRGRLEVERDDLLDLAIGQQAAQHQRAELARAAGHHHPHERGSRPAARHSARAAGGRRPSSSSSARTLPSESAMRCRWSEWR